MSAAVGSIPLSGGYVALVDITDLATLAAMGAWHAVPSGRTVYAARNDRRGDRYATVRMHNVITGLSYVDHVNGDGLDNRRSNLRPATHGQNMANKRRYRNNTSGFKGVTWHGQRERWQARLWSDGKQHYLGLHDTAEAAARAYDEAASSLFGTFARLNFPKEQSS